MPGFFQNEYEGVGASVSPWHFGSLIWNPEQGPPKSNLVYKNSYESLAYGLTVLGNNAGTDPSGDFYQPEKGLKFDCNTLYSPQARDVTAALGDGVSIQQGGYPANQNEKEIAVANRFINGYSGNGWEIWNSTGSPGMNYYHLSNPESTPDGPVGQGYNAWVNPLDVGLSYSDWQNNVCKDSVLRDEPGGIIIGDIEKAISGYKIQSRGLREKSDSLKGLVDGGKTQQLLKMLKGNTPPGKVKKELLKHSPYLSDTVLMTAMDQGLPPGILKQVLVSNSSLVDSVYQDFKKKKGTPKGIKMQVKNEQNGISPRVKLESRAAHYGARSSHLINRVMRIYVHNDSISGRLDSLYRILREREDVSHRRCRRAQLKTTTGDFQEARTILDSAEAEHSSLKNFCELQRLIIDLEEASKSCISAVRKDSAREGDLRKLAQDRTEHGCLRARAILERAFNERIREVYPPQINGQLKSSKEKKGGKTKEEKEEKDLGEEKPGRVAVLPNPVQEAFKVNFKGSYQEKQWNLELVDVSGRTVKRLSSSGSEDPKVNVRELESGIYFLRMRSNDGVRNLSKKLVVKGE